MSIPQFIPIESDGMSVITGIVLSFGAIGATAVLKWVTNKFQEQDEKIKDVDIRVDHHDQCVDDLRVELADGRVQFAEVKGTMDKIQSVVDRIEFQMTEVRQMLLKRGN